VAAAAGSATFSENKGRANKDRAKRPSGETTRGKEAVDEKRTGFCIASGAMFTTERLPSIINMRQQAMTHTSRKGTHCECAEFTVTAEIAEKDLGTKPS
jgi:hypothetical protein